MLSVTVAEFLKLLVAATLLGILIAAIVLALVWVTQLRSRVNRALLEAYLSGLRRVHYDRIGLWPRAGRFRLQISEEAETLLADPTRTAMRRDPMILADIEKDERVTVIAELEKVWRHADRRWRGTLIVLIVVVTCGCALASPYLRVPSSLFVEPAFASMLPLWGLAGVIGWLVLMMMERRAALPEIGAARLSVPTETPAADAVRDAEERAKFLAGQAQIGGPDEVVRALHLSSGGFDTIMHLGVAHALWVIQGRAPDAIVGISAGAIQGVAVAEVLQAGEQGEIDFVAQRRDGDADWTGLGDEDLAELQKARLLARAHRLRHFIEAAQRAPERLLDVLIPDTYQIDTAAPMRPLEGPRFPAKEREQRVAQLRSISGFTQLYNDLLGVSFSIGTLTRFARRVLGFVAAGDVQEKPVRWLIKSVEVLRLGLLVGTHLMEVARLLPILLRAYHKQRVPSLRTTGVLLFQSVVTRKVIAQLRYVFFFAALILLWALVSDVAFVVYVPVVVGLWLFWWHDREDVILKSAALDGGRGFVWFGLMAAFWTAIAAAMVFATGIALTAVGVLAAGGWRDLNPRTLGFDERIAIGWAVVIALLLLLAAVIKIWSAVRGPQRYSNRLLSAYDLANSILTEHGLRAFLVDMFDYGYYARAAMDRVVDQALQRRTGAPAMTAAYCGQKTVGYYSEKTRLQPIHLGLAVADTATGRLEVVPRATALVDGLLACTAVVPWMPAVELESPRDKLGRRRRTLFIDGGNVSREPTRALLKMIRGRLHEGTKVIHIYSVTPFPVSQRNLDTPALPPTAATVGAGTAVAPKAEKKLWLNLVETAWRALRLQRFRDATLERRLTEKFSELIPTGSVDALTASGNVLRMFRAWVAPVELESDADVNRRILGATKDERRHIMYEAMADGCRASLQIMMAKTIQAELASAAPVESPAPVGGPGGKPNGGAAPRTLRCSLGVARHRKDAPIPDALKAVVPVGGDPRVGPGLAEICEHCCLWRGTSRALEQTLLLGEWSELGPSWPHERGITADANVTSGERFRKCAKGPTPREQVIAAIEAAQKRGRMTWPRNRRDPSNRTADPKRPTVSLLFSGGVFRGVYQMGVLNALHELGVQPDLIAGASVGTITAAMVADAFARKHACERCARIARLASVYLAVDRLVMSDRLADFVRNLTLRAADTGFSIREADRLFRRYDAPKGPEFDRNARNVIAGIERLLYISPYELNRLVRALRGRDLAESALALHRIAQQYLDRMQIGDEALGAEALELLIREYVIGDRHTENPGGFTIDELRTQSGVQFLATATNLTHGRLDVFGDKPAADAGSSAVLQEVLLASSAFPAVFRPRWSWESEPGDGDPVQYIDGGVTDNLPLDAVTQFLERAASAKLIARAPAAPHLVIAASLEVNAPQYILEFTRRELKQSWTVLRKRAKALGYNRKLDTYADAQDRMRSVTRQLSPQEIKELSFTPVDLKVVAIKPDWLCGTFSFHPMLGFERTQQARSIAHGCAGTLLKFARMAQDAEQASWMVSWQLDAGDLPKVIDWSAAFREHAANGSQEGDCWLRKGKKCPFGAGQLRKMNAELQQQKAAGEPPAKNCGEVSEEMTLALDEIYRVCPQRKTHLREI